MKVVISPDAYKGTLTAMQICEVITKAIHQLDENVEIVSLPIADGGEGTLEPLIYTTKGQFIETEVVAPLGNEIVAKYGVLGDQRTCVIEMAQASGIMLVNEKAPFRATSYGTGQLIRHALDNGYRKFIIGIGGSATNDAGIGMLQALGMKFLNILNQEVGYGINGLREVEKIDVTNFDERIMQSEFIIACDVENPFVGINGATAVFGRQKGIQPHEIQEVDTYMAYFAQLVAQQTNFSLWHTKGAGAAGGVGGAFLAFFGANMRSGIDVVLDIIQFERQIQHAHFVITGEGKSDLQTLEGKAPIGVAKRASAQNIPTILLSGIVEPKAVPALQHYFDTILTITNEEVTAAQSMALPKKYLFSTVQQWFQQIQQK